MKFSAYGYCPKCGAEGVTRERRLDGNDMCFNGHTYPSKDAVSQEKKNEVDTVYETFWKPLIEQNGKLNVEQLKKELFDFWQVMQSVPKVYSHVTGGKISKILTDPQVVNSMADDHYHEDEPEGWCGHCACQSCYEAKRRSSDNEWSR